MDRFTVSRQIAIDAGHRVMTHGSKCRHLHGHRYLIEAVCIADHLQNRGEQADMVVDFGFLKEEMLAEIDAPCDHGFLAHIADVELLSMFRPEQDDFLTWLAGLQAEVARDGHCLTENTRLATKLYVLDVNPTAEQLSRHWYHRLAPKIAERSVGLAKLDEIIVWETPNCRASYRA
jgi:6-pyruvoyltetrahydropterin/6-carboxytetrahydropterin synthase